MQSLYSLHVVDILVHLLQGALPEPLYTHSQRWGRAFVTEPLGAEMLFLPAQRLVLCGDVCTGVGATVHSAFLCSRTCHEMFGGMA